MYIIIKNSGLEQYGAEPFEQQQLALKGLILFTRIYVICMSVLQCFVV